MINRMKLLVVAFLLSAASAFAQTTNISFTVRVIDAVSTNTFTLNAPTNFTTSVITSYAQYSAVNTNVTPFTNYVRNQINQRLRGVSDDVFLGQLVTSGAAQLPALWPTFSTQDQNTLILLFQRYLP